VPGKSIALVGTIGRREKIVDTRLRLFPIRLGWGTLPGFDARRHDLR